MTQIINVRNDRGDNITTDAAAIIRIIRKYYKHIYTYKFNN